jgi:hypothetical protein
MFMGSAKSWFRITWSIRTLLLLMALAAVALAWQVPRWRRASAIKTLEKLGAELEGKNGEINVLHIPSYNHGFAGTIVLGGDTWKEPRRTISLMGDIDTLASITIEPGDLRHHSLRPLLRLERLRNVDIRNAVLSKANLEIIAALPALESLRLSSTYFEGDALEPLARCKELKYLALGYCSIEIPFDTETVPTPKNVNDESESKASRELRTGKQIIPCSIDDKTLSIVRRMKALKELSLNDLPVDTEKLEAIRGMDSLERLFLSDTDIDDTAIDVLLSFPRLKHVGLINTNVTRDGVMRLIRESKIEKVNVDTELEKALSNDLNEDERKRVNPVQDEPFDE